MLKSSETMLLKNCFPFWEQLTNSQKDSLLNNAQCNKYESGRSLHVCDMDCIGVIIIKSGILRTYILSDEGREITLYRLTDKEVCILSASCVLKTITFDVHIEAETDCEILQISSVAFSEVMENNIYVEEFTYRMATERFSDVMWTMQQILFKSLDRRLAAFLIDESIQSGSDTILLTHEQIARYMGSAREVVSRMLRYFVKEGYVSVTRGKITLLNKAKLRELV